MKTNEQKRASADERQAHWNSLSNKEKLADLDRRLGKGVGAEKQRGRLIAAIQGDLEKSLKYALAYGAGPATIETIKKRFEV